MEWNCLGNIGRGPNTDHLCEVIMNQDQRFRKSPFKIFLIYSSDGHLIPGASHFRHFW